MFYVINYENGEMRNGEFNSYTEALNYAESRNSGYEFCIEEYDNENDYNVSLWNLLKGGN